MKNHEKLLLGLTAILTVYNLFEILLVIFGNNSNSVNGFFDLLLPVVIIANLVWAAKKKTKPAFMSLGMSALCIVGVIVMLGSVTITPF